MKIAIITGASSGIGREFARQIPRLYKQLDEIWLVARSTEKLKELEKELPLPVKIFDGDLMRNYIFERIEKELARCQADVRMLVNGAGYGKIGSAFSLDIQEQLGMIDLNCKALARMTFLSLPYMSKGSRIIQIASAAAFAPQPDFAVYAATKSFVYSFSRGVGSELKKRGIYMTTVCPGPVDTAFFERAGQCNSKAKQSVMAGPVEVVKKALTDSVAKRDTSVFGTPMKAARIAAKLLPDRLIMWMMKKSNLKEE